MKNAIWTQWRIFLRWNIIFDILNRMKWMYFNWLFLATGILLEGLDCILSSSVGSGFGVTSCSQNIGVISLTKVRHLTINFKCLFLLELKSSFSSHVGQFKLGQTTDFTFTSQTSIWRVCWKHTCPLPVPVYLCFHNGFVSMKHKSMGSNEESQEALFFRGFRSNLIDLWIFISNLYANHIWNAVKHGCKKPGKLICHTGWIFIKVERNLMCTFPHHRYLQSFNEIWHRERNGQHSSSNKAKVKLDLYERYRQSLLHLCERA